MRTRRGVEYHPQCDCPRCNDIRRERYKRERNIQERMMRTQERTIENKPTIDEMKKTERAEDYLKFQAFNVSSMLPGWRDRLTKSWGNTDY